MPLNKHVFISKKKSLLAFAILSFFTTDVSAQIYNLNFGLAKPQDTSTLPRSLARPQQAVPVAKRFPKTLLNKNADGDFSILNGWEMAAANTLKADAKQISSAGYATKMWYNATVPGTVLTTLVNQGVYPNPYFGLNNLYIPDSLARMDWWYRTNFELPKEKENKQVWLLFKGINYNAQIWLNGNRIGEINGAFKRGKFNVTNQLLKGKNTLAVHILPTNNPGIPHEESPSAGQGPNGGQLALDGPTFISSEGWDWMPGIRDRNIGIWQDVCLSFTGAVTIIDPHVVSDLDLPDTTRAKLNIKTKLYNDSKVLQQVTISGKIENISFERKASLKPQQSTLVSFSPEDFAQLIIKNPRLWWPNGYGRPELYHLQLEVRGVDGILLDRKTIRFGIRELSYEMTVDLPNKNGQRLELNPITALKQGKPLFDNVNRREAVQGVWVPQLRKGIDANLLQPLPESTVAPYLVLKVNGKSIYCKGGNWGMDDAMKKTSRNFLEPYFRLHKDANFNMIRNWTGESTQESFYELSDEYGMLVWNDFWMSTEGYNLYPKDNALFLANAKDVIVRYRNHPSIVIWCARNEGAPQEVIENGLADLVAKEDGTRLYQPNSRNLNLRPSGPWHYFKKPEEYFTKQAIGFNTELGTPSIPTAASIRKMMAKEDTWPINDVWYYHDLHDGQKDFRKALEDLYGAPTDLDDFSKKAQLINYDSHRAMFEAWNSKLWNSTSGLLLWMTHPAWPSMVWQVYSWDYETFGSYFGAKKACEPVHIQMNMPDQKIVVVNASLKKYAKAQSALYVYDTAGREIHKKVKTIDLAENKLTECFEAELPNKLPEVYLARVILKDNEGNLISQNDYWKATNEIKKFKAFNELGKINLAFDLGVSEKKVSNETTVMLANHSKVPAVSIKLNLVDRKTGDIILPAYFSDGYFNLLPGESRLVSVALPANYNWDNLTLKAEGYNIADTHPKKMISK